MIENKADIISGLSDGLKGLPSRLWSKKIKKSQNDHHDE
jgi:hypothetical protein